MNSMTTTFPRKDDKEIDWPVNPFGPTAGNVKSDGKPPEVTLVVVVERTWLGTAGWESEYAPQIARSIMIGIAIFSALLNPLFF
jgi:hypothetical protein